MTDFKSQETPVHAESDDARAGETTGRVRYILVVSVALAAIIMGLIVWGPLMFR